MARNQWFRMHSEAKNDRKLEALTDAQFRLWFKLLCHASEAEERGCVDCSDMEYLGIELNADQDAISDAIERMVRVHLLTRDGEFVVFPSFMDRQYSKPSDRPSSVSTRVTKHRETRCNASETPDTATCNANETPSETRQDSRAEQRIAEDNKAANRAPRCFTPSDREQIAAKIAVRFPSSTDADVDKAVESLLAGCDKQCSGLHSCWVAFFDAKLAKAKSVAGLVRFLSEDGRAA